MARRTRTRRGTAGFTLIEMMVVMVIIGLLMALVGPRFIRQSEKAKVGAARAQIELLGTSPTGDPHRADPDVVAT